MKKYSFLTILTLASILVFGQIPLKITQSSKSEFDVSKKKETPFTQNSKIVKSGKIITIKTTKGKIVKFEDDLSDENYQINEYVGDLIKDKIALIKTQDYNTDRFVAVNLSTGDEKTLIGTPHIFENKVICLQGAETDVKQEIQLWNLTADKLTMTKSFNLPDKIYPEDIAWKDANEIIIEDSNGKFWKTSVNGK